MANEAVVTDLLGNGGDPIEYTCADGTTIAKGELLELTDPRTVKKISADNKPVAGIAAAEKVASDGATTIAVLTNCIAKMVCEASGATVGFDVAPHDATNTVSNADAADRDEGLVLGYALETATSGETFLVRIQK